MKISVHWGLGRRATFSKNSTKIVEKLSHSVSSSKYSLSPSVLTAAASLCTEGYIIASRQDENTWGPTLFDMLVNVLNIDTHMSPPGIWEGSYDTDAAI